MAKRKRLEAPSADTLSALEQSLNSNRGGRHPGVSGPPIAQVAAEAAQAAELASPEDRAAQLKIAAEAARLRRAEEQGLLISELPLSEIDASYMTRDRTELDPEALAELMASIRHNGMRLPIEVCQIKAQGDQPRYGLISGYRRLTAVAQVAKEDGVEAPLIRALIRPTTDRAAGLVAMVEENEIREDLTPYERGRIAVISVREGAFDSLEDAVNALYASASKAKRSKIRSFARVFEALGDDLRFGPALKETEGLALAKGLKDGKKAALTAALKKGATSPDQEMKALKDALSGSQPPKKRQEAPPAPQSGPTLPVESTDICEGVSMQYRKGDQNHQLRFHGHRVDEALMLHLMVQIEEYLKGEMA